MKPSRVVLALFLSAMPSSAAAQQVAVVLRPDRVFDGEALREGWAVLEDLEGRPEVRSYLLTGNTPAGARAKLALYELDRFFHRSVRDQCRDRAECLGFVYPVCP